MRDVPDGLAARLAAGVTTLARCWTLARRDGLVLGFTDHDEDIWLDGVLHAAASGLEAADMQSELGFAVGGGEVSGALTAPGLVEADLAAGRWDAADVTVRLVDWREPALAVLIERGTIGEVRRAGSAFAAEIRGLAHRLDEPRGRLFQAPCSADFGDDRCGLDASDPAWSGQGRVVAGDGRRFLVASGLGAHRDGLFTGGRLLFTQGAGAGIAVEVQLHRRATDAAELTLWEPMPAPPAPGDAFTVTAGCDKRFTTCRDRFGNATRFRGFPHMPGTDAALRAVNAGEPGLDGGSLFR